MKYVFDDRSLAGHHSHETAVPPDGARAVCGDSDGFRPMVVCLRMVVIIVVVSLVLFLVARPYFVPILVGAMVTAFQTLVVELVFGVLMRRGRAKTSAERAIRGKRMTTAAWAVEIVLACAGLFAIVLIYSLWK